MTGSSTARCATSLLLALATTTCGDGSGPPPEPARLAFGVQPVGTTAGSAITPGVVVVVQDANGRTVTNATTAITLAITPGTGGPGATLEGPVQVSAVAGEATFNGLVIELAAGYTLTATAPNLTAATSSPFTITASVPTQLGVVTHPVGGLGGEPIAPTIEIAVQDAFGNAVPGATHTITIGITAGTGAAGATLSGTKTRTPAATGVAAFPGLIIDKFANSYTLTATAAGLTEAVSDPFYVDVGSAVKLAFTTQPSPTTVLAAITPPVVVEAQDAGGNLILGFLSDIDIAITPGTGGAGVGAVLSGATSRAADRGSAPFTDLTLDRVGTGFTLTATTPGLTSAVSSSFDVGAGTGLHLVFSVQPTTATAGVAIAPAIQVSVKDGSGATVTTATDPVSLDFATGMGPAGYLNGTWPINAEDGVATFADISTSFAGTGYRLTATAPGIASATSDPFDIVAGAPAKLRFTVHPSNAAPGTPISPTVEVMVLDALLNHVPTATNSITLSIVAGTGVPGAVLSGAGPLAAVGGVASFPSLSIDLGGLASPLYQLKASGVGLAEVVSGLFKINE